MRAATALSDGATQVLVSTATKLVHVCCCGLSSRSWRSSSWGRCYDLQSNVRLGNVDRRVHAADAGVRNKHGGLVGRHDRSRHNEGVVGDRYANLGVRSGRVVYRYGGFHALGCGL